jgi:3-deoxy-D-manno-octulosonate 8-phosphate phosphatase (KDO 8-P phosphatase)
MRSETMSLCGLFRRRRVSPRDIALLVLDFDGVFTDNRVIVSADGGESVICNRADGLGISRLRERQIAVLVLSTETHPVVTVRVRKLGVEVLQGIADKAAALTAYCANKGISIQKVMYVGNDMNDYEVMKIVGFSAAPQDAHPEIRRIARYLIPKKGGEGVIRELAENLIK